MRINGDDDDAAIAWNGSQPYKVEGFDDVVPLRVSSCEYAFGDLKRPFLPYGVQ